MKNRFLIILLLGFCVSGVFAESEEIKLTLEQAVQCALENNSSIKQGQIKLNQSERSYKHSWNNFLPSVRATVSASENEGFTSHETDMATLSTGVNASLNFSAGLGKKLQSIKQSYETGKLDFDDTLSQIEVSVTKAFYSILYMSKQVDLSKDTLASYEKQYEQTKIKKSLGVVSELDLLTSQVNLETSKINLKNTEKAFNNSLVSFLNDIGYESTEKSQIVLDGSLDDYEIYSSMDFSTLDIESLIENSSSIRSLKASINQTELSLAQTKLNTYLPSLSLSASINPYTESYMWESEIFKKTDGWNASIGLSYSLDSLVPGSSAKDSIASLQDSLATQNIQLLDTRRQITASVYEMINNIEIAKDTLTNCEQNVELAKKSYELAEIAYRNGSKELSALQTVQSSYNNAVVQLNNQQLTLISSIIELKNLLGIKE